MLSALVQAAVALRTLSFELHYGSDEDRESLSETIRYMATYVRFLAQKDRPNLTKVTIERQL